ncbi:MAG: alpha/beta hydrolase family protein [Burkholderiaceae bacterium]
MPKLLPGVSNNEAVAQLPPDVLESISQRNPDEDLAGFAGAWSGWGGRGGIIGLALAVEPDSTGAASIVVIRTADSIPPLEHRGSARLVGQELIASLPSGTQMRYRLRNADTMEFVWRSTNGNWMAGILSRSNERSVMRRMLIPTQLTENSARVSLEAVIYQPDGKGPFPTLVFNHGSTGTGSDSSLFSKTWAEPNIARWFTQRGWMVVFPQRRGRGRSTGLYREGLEEDGSGYSIRPEVSLPGIDRALTDIDTVVNWATKQAEVNAERMLIGGQSRGGLLSVVYAGTRPEKFMGAINFVGGWMGDRLEATRAINREAFLRGAGTGTSSLWLYADQDPFYSLEHSRANFAAYMAAGGKGEFHALAVKPKQNGHQVIADSQLWGARVDAFIKSHAP